jgi:hypothetical protein
MENVENWKRQFRNCLFFFPQKCRERETDRQTETKRAMEKI